MANENETPTKRSKFPNALVMFLVIGLTLNTLLNYTQTSTIQDTTAARAVVGDEILQNSRETKEKLDEINKQLTELQLQLNPQKAGKTVQ